MRVLLTGATGFLGKALVKQLMQQGHTVRALVRKSSNTQWLSTQHVEMVVGSLEPAENLDAAVQDVDAIIHSAGGGYARTVDDFYRNNLHTTKNLLSAAKSQSIKRFTLVSSIAAHGPSRDGTPRPPDAPCEPITHYGRSKAKAEAAVLECAEKIPVTIVRPPAIYGPGDVRMLALFKSANRGLIPLPSPGKTTSLIHVDDCARAISATLNQSNESGKQYFVEDGTMHSFEDMAREIGRAVGKQPLIIKVPTFLLRIVSLFAVAGSRFRNKPALLTRDKVNDLAQPHWVCSSDSIQKDLGWKPIVAFRDGARETANWYRTEGWIK